MKKLLIATTALVATAGMASADITITGSANAGYYSGLSNKDGLGKVTGSASTKNVTAANVSDQARVSALAALGTATDTRIATPSATNVAAEAVAQAAYDKALAADLAADLAVHGRAANPGTYTKAGIYSNAGIVVTMTGATDNGITFSTSVYAEAGTEIDTGDFELDCAASGAFGLGAVSATGAFGTVTFDDNGIDNLYDDDLVPAHDVKYATSVGGVALTVATNAQQSADQTSMSAAYTSGAMTFTVASSDSTAGTSASALVSYVVSDSLTVRAKTDQAAGAESTQKIGVTTSLNGVSIVADTSNDSTWDVSLGYTVNGVALTYASDESDAWSATASYALGGGATASAGLNAEDSMYAGVSFAF